MTLRVSNTLSGEREEFEPRHPGSVLLYYCGLTTSAAPHLGHARGWVHVDVMHRWLEYLGYEVHHVENFTDVNEKIVARIGEDDYGESEAAVARHFVADTISAMRSLNLRRADVYPRVSEHVPEIIELVRRLIDRGHAYEAGGSVYFDVTSFPEYGKLSNQDLDELEAQGEGDAQAEKRHPADFALWKAGAVSPEDAAEHRSEGLEPLSEPRGQTWDSPWGEGRPGWHIECSAMSTTHLDETIDVHVGGQDLVFPHHENEIAQSEAATGQQFARYWLHVRLLETETEKMSSSLGNFFTVEDAVAEYGPNVVRMFLLSTVYTQRQTFSVDAVDEADKRWDRLARGYERAVEAADSVDARTTVEDTDLREAVETAREDFVTAMNDDFNTREAIAGMLDIVGAVNRHVEHVEHVEDVGDVGDVGDVEEVEDVGEDEDVGYDYRGLRRAIEAFEELAGGVLGFAFEEDARGQADIADELIELVLEIREREREVGNYERADRLRADLQELGIEVQDTDDGPTYRR